MAKHRREYVKPLMFDAAISINNMERAVIYRMVDFNSFTTDDVIDWLFPSDAVRALRAAYPYASDITHASQTQVAVHLGDTSFTIWIDYNAVSCLHPRAEATMQETLKAPLLASTLLEIAGIVREFNIVRSVVGWFNDNDVTPGFARHYFPALGGLLAHYHLMNLTSGKTFHDKAIPYEMRGLIRQAPAVIAKGLFCDPENHSHKAGTSLVRVRVSDGEVIPILTRMGP